MPTWLLLTIAIAFEVTATSFLRLTEGFTKLWPTVVVALGYGASFYLVSLVLKTGIPQGIVYAIWSAVGVALVTMIGIWFFDDRITTLTAVGLVVVIIGVVLVQAGHTGVEA
jgi:small multidrug resistance pump